MSSQQFYYTTPDKVASFLDSVGLSGIRPEYITPYISLAEAEIEAVSYTCYAGKPCLSRVETHSLTLYLGGVWIGLGIPIHLRHRPVRRIVKFEVFNGKEYVDMLKEQEARVTGAWWCDYPYGVCFLNQLWWWQGGREVRIQYEYGWDELPSYVEQAATLLAAKYYLVTERNRLTLVDTDQSLDFRSIIDLIDQVLATLMPRIRGIGIPTGLY